MVPLGCYEHFPPPAEAKSEQKFNFITPYDQCPFTSAEQKAEEPFRAAGSSQLDEKAAERKMTLLVTKKAPQLPPRSFSFDAGSDASFKNLGTEHYSQRPWCISSEPSWTRSTVPSVIRPQIFETSSSKEKHQRAGKIDCYHSSSDLYRDPFSDYSSSLIKKPMPKVVAGPQLYLFHLPTVSSPSPAISDVIDSGPFITNSAVSAGTTSHTDTKHKYIDKDDGLSSSFFSGSRIMSLPDTPYSWERGLDRYTRAHSGQSTVGRGDSSLFLPGLFDPPADSRLTAHSCPESVNEDTEEHPDARSLHELLEPATRLELSSPMEADSRLQSSTTDSCERKEVSRSSSFPSSPKRSAKSRSLKRAASLPDMKLKSSFEEFSPDCTDEFDGESYRFQCSCPGLYQCRETGLVFDMKEGGQVLYRILTWNRRQLRPHHKKPAGPLFNIKCLKEGSMSQLHLPHCEIRSTGGCGFLSVAHVKDDGIEFLRPEKITETHVIIKVTGFSGFGIVKDEDSPSVPIRALVLLFYKRPLDPDHEYCISVLLLPRNISLRHVQRTRKELYGDETFIETPPHCKLCPRQVYSLTTSPGGDSVEVQPSEEEFDEDYDDNYFPTFCVTYERMMEHIKLVLEDSSSTSVWKRQVRLPSSGVKRSCGSASLNLPPNQHLLEVRSSFINGISESNLKSLLDKLLEKKVINDHERESAEERGNRGNRGDRARVVLDTVMRKGEAASSEMMEILRELDPFLCRDLGLI